MTARPTDAPERSTDAPWFVGERTQTVIAIILTLTAGLGLAVIVLSVTREEPQELVAGLVIILLSAAVLAWSFSERHRHLALLAAIGLLVQVLALLYYHYTGFARDANSYHRAAVALLDPDDVPPPRMAFRSTEWSNWAVVQITATIYRVTGASQLMAFVAFATVGLIAKLVFAATMLRMRPVLGRAAELAAFGVVVFPSLALWLSPISKEAPAVLGIALVIAGVVRPPEEHPRVWLIALGLVIAASTRPHISMLLGVSVVAFASTTAILTSQSMGRRLAILVGAAALSIGSIVIAANFFGVDPSFAGMGEVRDDLAAIEDDGGSSIEPRPIRAPVDVPFAVANVLIRPYVFETTGLGPLLQSLETMFLVLLALWLTTQGARRQRNRVHGAARRHLRTLRVFALTYTAMFVFSFSGMYNLGLMSRQRTQFTLVLLLLLAMSLVSTRRGRQQRQAPLVLISTGDHMTTSALPSGRHGPLVELPANDHGDAEASSTVHTAEQER